MDIFEKLKNKIGCTYISDMRFGIWQEIALEEIDKMNVTPNQKQEVINYITN